MNPKTGFNIITSIMVVVFAAVIYALLHVVLGDNIFFVVIGLIVVLVYFLNKKIKRKY